MKEMDARELECPASVLQTQSEIIVTGLVKVLPYQSLKV